MSDERYCWNCHWFKPALSMVDQPEICMNPAIGARSRVTGGIIQPFISQSVTDRCDKIDGHLAAFPKPEKKSWWRFG